MRAEVQMGTNGTIDGPSGANWALLLCLPCSAVIQKEDDEGKVGVKIGKELMKVAGIALKTNITRLGPLVLPFSEQLIFAGNFVARKVLPLKVCSSFLGALRYAS